MKRLVLAWPIAAAAFLALDAPWLMVMTPRLYQPEIGALLAAEPRMGPAVLFYVLYISGIVAFAIAPALQRRSARGGLVRGAGLGLLAYGTYDLTSHAVLAVWSWRVTLIDMAWGTALTGAAAFVASWAVLKLERVQARR
jgi:uncharacterized membrane protein